MKSFELINRFRELFFSQPIRKKIYLVAGGGWAFYWIAFYLNKYITQMESGIDVEICTNPWKQKPKDSIIFFISRQKYFRGDYKSLCRDNYVFLLWAHGDPRSLKSGLSDAFGQLAQTAQEDLKKIIVPCELTQEDLIQYGISRDKMIVIPFGVDLEIFKPIDEVVRNRIRKQMDIPTDACCIGSFQKDGDGWNGGIEPKLIKGPDVFLNALEGLKKQVPNLYVLLTGPSRGYVKQGLQKAHIPFRHDLITQEDYKSMARYYQALDMYWITSRCEGGPLALPESWACGVPVVSTPVGMSADWIQHGVNGYIAPHNDIEKFAVHSMNMIRDNILRNKIIEQGLKSVEQLSWPNIAKMTLDQAFQNRLALT